MVSWLRWWCWWSAAEVRGSGTVSRLAVWVCGFLFWKPACDNDVIKEGTVLPPLFFSVTTASILLRHLECFLSIFFVLYVPVKNATFLSELEVKKWLAVLFLIDIEDLYCGWWWWLLWGNARGKFANLILVPWIFLDCYSCYYIICVLSMYDLTPLVFRLFWFWLACAWIRCAAELIGFEIIGYYYCCYYSIFVSELLPPPPPPFPVCRFIWSPSALVEFWRLIRL